jgi:hypothetical protein
MGETKHVSIHPASGVRQLVIGGDKKSTGYSAAWAGGAESMKPPDCRCQSSA